MEVSDPGWVGGIHSVAIFMEKVGNKDSKAVTAGGLPPGLFQWFSTGGGFLPDPSRYPDARRHISYFIWLKG